MKFLAISIFALIAIYVTICAFMFFSQKNLIHIPYAQFIDDPSNYGMHYEEVYLDADDGARLHAWYLPHPEAQYTFWIFSGNAGNKSYMLDSIEMIYKLGYSVFIFDYRGFGPSTGHSSEQAMYRDTELGWAYLTKTRAISPDRIILHGRSLGTAMASWLAANRHPAALIMESGFTSMADMAKRYYRWLPIDLLLRWQYNNLERIASIQSPILFIHSPDDELTPYTHSQQLFDAAPDNKRFLNIFGDHLEGFKESRETYTSGIEDFMTEFVKSSAVKN